jgi:hypothetical protein
MSLHFAGASNTKCIITAQQQLSNSAIFEEEYSIAAAAAKF